ncbi:hypothetical protein [Spongiactinospora sp. TRM90649]|uniref:hypothetical protein n=1 Tax=Spongiactinospora sp. TRM90649 TaxID=3031114 RepID=UPI0023F6CA06|nr:hypothetical protein [Spongiactinospora sp. TRM90649]MDF5752865.1 hypothetical protein [Spongiactinospora sp. TRM90649]
MTGTFKDRLLVELKAEMIEREERGRRPAVRRRLMWGAGVVGAAASALVAVPLVSGQGTPAYAVTERPDGSINLTITEFRDADQVERDLAELGVTADITYLPLGKRCDAGRARPIPGDMTGFAKEELQSKDPAVRERIRKATRAQPSYRAIRPEDGITIYPRFIERDQKVLIEVMENPEQVSRERPGVAWAFSGRLAVGPIAPCRVVDDPGAFEVGDATPPPGS